MRHSLTAPQREDNGASLCPMSNLALTTRRARTRFRAVSASDIVKELPNLTEAERRTFREGLLELANQEPDAALCNQAALDGALMLDRMEDEDARRKSV